MDERIVSVLRKIAADAVTAVEPETADGFMPGVLKRVGFFGNNDDAGYSYTPKGSKKTYTYNRHNVPVWANRYKNKEVFDKLLTTGKYSTDALDVATMNDPGYPEWRRKHLARVPKKDWNAVAIPMDPKMRRTMKDVTGVVTRPWIHPAGPHFNLMDRKINIDSSIVPIYRTVLGHRLKGNHQTSQPLTLLQGMNSDIIAHEGGHAQTIAPPLHTIIGRTGQVALKKPD